MPFDEPICIECRHPVGTLIHIMDCSPLGRACFECDKVWLAEDVDATEKCPRKGCDGVGEPTKDI